MHQDSALSAVIEALRNECRGARRAPATLFGSIIRQALDEVFDGPRTGRYSLDELDKTEKTYIGTKLEIIVRSELGLDRGKTLDLSVNGRDVDVKWSQTLQWMIGPENIGKLCLGLGLQRGGDRFSVGVFRARKQLLRSGRNRDRKFSLLAAAHRNDVHWLVSNELLPPNFVAQMPPDIRERVLRLSGAQERITMLGKLMPGVPIPRQAILTLVPGRGDPIRRLRRDRARTEALAGVVFISSKYGRQKLAELGVEKPPSDCWYAFPEDEVGD